MNSDLANAGAAFAHAFGKVQDARFKMERTKKEAENALVEFWDADEMAKQKYRELQEQAALAKESE